MHDGRISSSTRRGLRRPRRCGGAGLDHPAIPHCQTVLRKNPRGNKSREDRSQILSSRSVDDLDDLARPRLDDHPAVIHDRVAIFGVARNRAQFDAGGSGSPTTIRSRTVTDGARSPWIEVITALGISRPQADRGTHRTADGLTYRTGDGATGRAPLRAPVAVVDWAKAALEASSDAASDRDSKSDYSSCPPVKLTIRFNNWIAAMFRHLQRFQFADCVVTAAAGCKAAGTAPRDRRGRGLDTWVNKLPDGQITRARAGTAI